MRGFHYTSYPHIIAENRNPGREDESLVIRYDPDVHNRHIPHSGMRADPMKLESPAEIRWFIKSLQELRTYLQSASPRKKKFEFSREWISPAGRYPSKVYIGSSRHGYADVADPNRIFLDWHWDHMLIDQGCLDVILDQLLPTIIVRMEAWERAEAQRVSEAAEQLKNAPPVETDPEEDVLTITKKPTRRRKVAS
jgi:hypothetical protein